MHKTKRMKSILFMLLVFSIGFTKVSASSYTGFDFNAQLYDNLGPTLNTVTTSGPTAGTGAYEGYIGYTANSSGGAWGISSPVSLIANHTYTLTASIPNECSNIILSTYNRIGVGTTLNNAKTSYENDTNVNEVYSKAIQGSNYLIQFAFTPTINGSFIVFPYATSKSCSSTRTFLESISIEDLGVEGVTQDEINNSLNNQTNEINNSIQNSTDTIINNQNQNNEELKDTINDNFNSCRDSVNLLDFDGVYSDGVNNNLIITYNSDSSLNIKGIPSQQWANIAYNNGITLQPGTYTFSSKDNYQIDIVLRLYNSDGSYNNFALWTGQTSITFTLEQPATWYYVFLSNLNTSKNYDLNLYLQLQKGSSKTTWEKPGEICSNKIDETNNQLGNLNSSLNDSNIDGSLSNAGSFFDNFTTTDHGGLSGIITAPLVAINQMLNTSCSPMTTTFKGKELSLPCGYEFWNKMGPIQDFINLVLGGLLCYQIIIKLYKLIEKIKNPEDDRLEVMDL